MTKVTNRLNNREINCLSVRARDQCDIELHFQGLK